MAARIRPAKVTAHPDERGRVQVALQLPVTLVKVLDHWRIEQDMTRQDAVAMMLAWFLATDGKEPEAPA